MFYVGPSTLDTIGAPVSKVADAPAAPSAAEKQSAYAQELAAVPEFSAYGPVINSSATPSQLTESETEYQVNCVKHIFKEHVVFQVSLFSLLIMNSPTKLFFSSIFLTRFLTPSWSKSRSLCNLSLMILAL